MFGPIYCETPAIISSFPAEPLNTWSNLIIVAFGLAALWIIYRRAPRNVGLWSIGALLLANGVGSFLWHGLRAPWALSLDALPGVLFLLIFIYLWAERLFGHRKALVVFIVFGLVEAASFMLFVPRLPPGLLFIPAAPAIVALGFWFIIKTARVSRRAAGSGTALLFAALLALNFRSIDLGVCATFPTGTHFLWHIFLSLAAYLGILTLLELKKGGT